MCISDVDECVEGGSRCLAEAVCQNLAGTHHCYCPEGQEGDGVNCCLSSSLVQQLSNHSQPLNLISISHTLTHAHYSRGCEREEKEERNEKEKKVEKSWVQILSQSYIRYQLFSNWLQIFSQ